MAMWAEKNKIVYNVLYWQVLFVDSILHVKHILNLIYFGSGGEELKYTNFIHEIMHTEVVFCSSSIYIE